MTVASRIRDSIVSGQTPIEEAQFRQRIQHIFSDTKDGFLDVQTDPGQGQDAGAQPEVLSTNTTAETAIAPSLAMKTSDGARIPEQRIRSVAELRTVPSAHATNQVFLIRQRNPRSQLSLSLELFEQLCLQYKVFAKSKEFVICFGIRKSEVLPPAPALHFIDVPDRAVNRPQPLGSGFEGMYILRFVEPCSVPGIVPWSILQSGIYHKFEPTTGSNTWILFTPTPKLEEMLHYYRTHLADPTANNPFELHYVLLDASSSDWKSCINFLSEEIERQSDIVFIAELEFSMDRLEERQMLKKVEDFIADLLVALSHTIADAKMLLARFLMYKTRLDPNTAGYDNEMPCDSGAHEDILQTGFERRISDLLGYQMQLLSLQRKVQTVSQLLSNLLDLSNGEALKLLALEAKQENARTAVLTQKSVEDAATVKILTIVTLVYLPLTVVTNFFSSSFVTTDSASHVSVTSDIWMLFVIGIPLTFLTIYIWWIFSRKEVMGAYPEHLTRLTKKMKRSNAKLPT